ncbi:MAG: DUF2786 domain-containing protein [Acidimicrobiales bacterium]
MKRRKRAHDAGRRSPSSASSARDPGRSSGEPGAYRSAPSAGRTDLDRRTAELLVHRAASALCLEDHPGHDRITHLLTLDASRPGSCVASALSDAITGAVGVAWTRGWQPADLHRTTVRKLNRRGARLAVAAVAHDAERYRHRVDADPGWVRQLDDIGATPTGGDPRPMMDAWAAAEGREAADAVAAGVELLALLWRLPGLPVLVDPPDRWGSRVRSAGARVPDGIDPKVLARVRALLAKAESTAFAEEAEAYTAKAQHLMGRHNLDRAAVEGVGTTEPGGRRISVDDPYAPAKALLLSVVAAAGRCRVVWSNQLGFSTVFGFPSDLEMVEILHTSLLVQATRAMLAAGAGGSGPHARSRSFRQSFLVAYAGRIGERLAETAADAVDEATTAHGAGLLPVLATRLSAVDEVRDKAFPDATTSVLSARSLAGRAAGTAAADLASLSVGPELPST